VQDSRKYLLATAPAFRGHDLGFEESDNAPEETDPRLNRSGANNPPGRRRNHRPANLSGARIVVGHRIASMSDADIVEMYNEILDAQWRLLQQWDKTVVEEPPGEKQIDYHENSDQHRSIHRRYQISEGYGSRVAPSGRPLAHHV